MKMCQTLFYTALAIAMLLPSAVTAEVTPPKTAFGKTAFGIAPLSEADIASMRTLVEKLQKLWSPNCAVPGSNQVQVNIRFMLSPDGHVASGPSWTNPRSDGVWIAGANRAMMAVKRGEPYDNLPEGFYYKPITITFDSNRACPSQ